MSDYIFGPPPPPPSKSNSITSTTEANRNQNSNNSRQQQRSSTNSSSNNRQRGGKQQRKQYRLEDSSISQQKSSNRQQYFNIEAPSFLQTAPRRDVPAESVHSKGHNSGLPENQKRMEGIATQQNGTRTFNLDLISDPVPDSTSTVLHDSSFRHQYKQPNITEPNELYDEGQFINAKSAVTIPGTTISLQTEADIAKWIAERRAKWPTAARMQEKEKERQQQQHQEVEDQERAQNLGDNSAIQKQNGTDAPAKKNFCRFFFKNGRCKMGNMCKFSHERSSSDKFKRSIGDRDGSSELRTKRYKRYEEPQRMPLFKRLVQNDLDKENSLILDFISFMVDFEIVHKSKAL
ncbi:nuclear fragile X mental retardation-interacting protein 1-domain-containing protein [Kockiozyma suomiensis]|uniref:nuclear fragile X mental retardation-interacting protein 1-domain-containing protein n=1 Tax=Kockiozyma suomiensis TaxID=1337062 RepID=UPI003343B4EC